MAEDFVPMQLSERMAEGIKDVVGPQAFLAVAAQAAIGQGLNRPREWRQGARGYGLRAGDAYAQRVLGAMFQDGIALALHEDNRYFNSGQRGFGRRLAYALSSSLVARHNDGSRSLSISTLAGIGASGSIARIWQPPSTSGWSTVAVNFGFTIAFRAGANVVREFSPRVIGGLIR